MTSNPRSVAVLGTGTMGAPMARRLLGAGLQVRVWNRTAARAEPLADDGATVARSPADAVRGVDAVLTVLYDAVAVEDVMAAAADALTPGTLWIQASTVGVEGERRLADVAARHDLAYVDAPVLGTRRPAEQGMLTVLASGSDDARARCEQIFDAVGSRTLWVGEAGAGSRLKLVVNAFLVCLLEGLAESVALAEGLGLHANAFLDAITGSGLDVPYAHVKGAAMIERNFPPSFSLNGALKDAGLVLEAAAGAGLDLAVVEAVRGHLAEAVDRGYGAQDMAAVYYVHS